MSQPYHTPTIRVQRALSQQEFEDPVGWIGPHLQVRPDTPQDSEPQANPNDVSASFPDCISLMS